MSIFGTAISLQYGKCSKISNPFSFCSQLKYSKTCLKRPLKKNTKIGFQDSLSLNTGQKYCKMLQGEHSAILSTFTKVPLVINILVLSIFEWPLKTGFTVFVFRAEINKMIVRKANREDTVQGLSCLSRPFWQGMCS